MNANAFITLAVIFLALAVILAAVAVVLYRRFDIPAVRDELTGRAAKREIESLRGTRAGQWDNMETPARDDRRHGRGKAAGRPGRAAQAGGPTTGSDIEFRRGTTGSASASGMGGTGSTGSRSGASTDAGATHPLPGATRPMAGAGATGRGAQASSAPGRQSARPAGKDGAKSGDQAVIEIPVAIASAAELADEGETSLMQFRKPSDNTSDDDESRTILVRAAKHAAPGDAAAKQHATNESKSSR